MSRSRIFTGIFIAILLLALPIPFYALLLFPNKYSIILGTQGAVDCGGPSNVMFFAVMSYAIYGFGGVVFATYFAQEKNRLFGYSAIICVLVMVLITPNFVQAYNETKRPDFIQSCIEGG